MQPAPLLPSERPTCPLLVSFDERPCGQGIAVRRGLLAEGGLTSVHRGNVNHAIRESTATCERLAPDNPFLLPQHADKLDSRGIVRAGTQLEAGDVLISLVDVQRDKAAVPGLQNVVDASVSVPDGWEGAIVESVQHRTRKELGRGAPAGVLELIEIRLRLIQPLAPGDLLITEHELFGAVALGVVAEWVPDETMPRDGERTADLLLSAEQSSLLSLSPKGLHELPIGKDNAVAAFQMFCSANCPRSLITKQPLSGGHNAELGSPHPRQSVKVSSQHIGWLRARGLNQIAAEFVSTKSDDVVAFRELRKFINRIDPAAVPPPGTPASLYLLDSELWAQGLVPEFSAGEHVSLTLRPATRNELLAKSTGEVRKPETINYRTYKPEREGIMCASIWGEKSDLHRFGHFDLGWSVVPYLWRVGKPSLLEQLLKIKPKQLKQLVGLELYVRATGSDFEWQESEEKEPDGEGWLTGAAAIVELLRALPSERLPPGLREHPEAIAQDVILLPPVWTRPLILLDSGNFATSDLNDLYRRIINRANRSRKLVDLKAPAVIVLNERRQLQEAVDALWANQLLPRKSAVMGSEKRPLLDIATICMSRLKDEDGKRVDWSGQARAVLDPALPANTVVLPRFIFETLRLEPAEGVLLTTPTMAKYFAANAQPGDDNVIRMTPLAYERLGTPAMGRLIQVHRLLSVGARTEAMQLNEATATIKIDVDPLLNVSDTADGLFELAQAAAAQRTISFASSRGVLTAGLGSVDFNIESLDFPRSPRPVQAIPIPPPPETREPTHAAIHQVIQSLRRKVWKLKTAKTTARLSPLAGRIGGRPCLPPDMPWPVDGDEPLPFIAQLPLDALGTFPPGSLLTLFLTQQMISEGHDSGAPCAFVVRGEDLAEREPPDPKLLRSQLAFTLTADEEIPDWEVVVAALKFEFETTDGKLFKKFHAKEWSKYSPAADVSRLGGWAHWIQSPESEDPLIAQLCYSDAPPAIDGGSLYVCQNQAGEFEVFLQYD